VPGLPDGRRISSSDGQWPKDGHHRLFPQFNVYICACTAVRHAGGACSSPQSALRLQPDPAGPAGHGAHLRDSFTITAIRAASNLRSLRDSFTIRAIRAASNDE
jgi:hypothetical protein